MSWLARGLNIFKAIAMVTHKRSWIRPFIILLVLCAGSSALAESWQQAKGKHFIVYFEQKQDEESAKAVLREAEKYYDRISRLIGYARYSDYWTWEERVRILVFKDQDSFMKKTHQPPWSMGYADRDSALFSSRVIVTFNQEQGFLLGLLPHEIGHLILRDFVGFATFLPLWFEEGVAQLEEIYQKENARKIMKKLARKNQYIPLRTLANWDVRSEQDPEKAAVFYAQSVSVVDFLMRHYGSTAFANLCRRLKGEMSFEEVLASTYGQKLKSLEDLERSWVNDLRN